MAFVCSLALEHKEATNLRVSKALRVKPQSIGEIAERLGLADTTPARQRLSKVLRGLKARNMATSTGATRTLRYVKSPMSTSGRPGFKG